MATADLVTKLVLENKQFDDNIKKSKEEIKNFENGAKAMSAGIKTSFFALAGAAGVAVGGMEVFNSIIQSTQTTGDAFQKTMDQAKASVEGFFTAIARGDIGNFMKNLDNIIEKAGVLSVMADELATKNLFTNRDLSKLASEMQIELNLSKDRLKSDEERNKHLEKSRAIQERINALTRDLAKTQRETGYQTIRTEMAKMGYKYEIQDSVIEGMFSEEQRGKLMKYHDEYKKLLDDMKASKQIYETQSLGGGYVDPSFYEDYQRAKKDFEDYLLTAEGAYAERAYAFMELPDDAKSALKAAYDLLNAADQLMMQLSNAELQLANSEAKISGGFNKRNKETSLTAEEKEQMNIALSEQEIRNGIKNEIENIYKNNPVTIPVPVEVAPYVESDEVSVWEGLPANIEATQLKMQDVTLKYNQATTDELRAIYAQQLADLQDHIDKMNGVNKAMIDISNEANGLMQSGIIQAFESIGEAISSDDASEAFRNWLIGLMDLLKQFGASLIAAGTAKIAFDKLIKNPYTAIIAGAALIVTTTAARIALQNASKPMAEGAIVYGETFARIGEYPGAAGNPEVVAPLDRLKDLIQPKNTQTLSGNVIFKIEGRELVGVLDNYKKQQRRMQ
ncbi:MAG: hypothetical protein LBS55_02205 [Prevotellaceae bacterium]|jgi:hypothetical protein|nr:hypothetical protein [Prevotellaceae bacterium]